MSIFAAGGSVGFFLAPVLATPALASLGLGATALFIPPAMLIGLFLLRHHQRALASQASRPAVTGPDQWAPFLVMTGVEIVRSVVFFGVNTFIELYWIHHLGASRGLAGAALACFLVGGVAGTLLGGRMADRIRLVRALATNIPFSVMIKLWQDYLPSRPGTATGVTLGLALILGAFLPDPAAPGESTADARSRRALEGRRGTPRSLLPGRSRGR
jgi:FSR family fosmidomycin resistance protein-like MFS transporter